MKLVNHFPRSKILPQKIKSSGCSKIIIFTLGLSLILMHCSIIRSTIEIGGYSFTHDHVVYRIESVTPNNMEGYNILVRMEGDRIVMKAIDKEQNGSLNEVLIGNLDLAEANLIYQTGIKEGERLGYIKKRTFAREYRTHDELNNYLLATYLLAVGEVYNKFRIISRQMISGESILIDLNADGRLDEIEKGSESMQVYQTYYRKILDKGIREFKIEKRNGAYIVII
jgi:hypothetical protein